MGWWVAYIAHQDIKNFQIQVHLNAINALIIAIVAITMLQLNLLNALNANMVILYKQTVNVYNVAPLLKQELVKYVCSSNGGCTQCYPNFTKNSSGICFTNDYIPG
jgi:hypothetical protein